jgi:hypothetical protein
MPPQAQHPATNALTSSYQTLNHLRESARVLRCPAGAVVAVLHASPGTECWAGLHAALKQAVKEAAADAPVVYAHRPVLPAACKVGH